MKRLDILKKERDEIMQMRCLSFNVMANAARWYNDEINAIENGSPNPEYDDPKLSAREVEEQMVEHCKKMIETLKSADNEEIADGVISITLNAGDDYYDIFGLAHGDDNDDEYLLRRNVYSDAEGGK